MTVGCRVAVVGTFVKVVKVVVVKVVVVVGVEVGMVKKLMVAMKVACDGWPR
jgi:hypothetical protein